MYTFRHAATLNTVGVIVLLVAIGSAVLVYRLGRNRPATSTMNSDWRDSSLSPSDSKVATRDIELYGGKVEVLMVKWLGWLQRPEFPVIIIAALSALIALCCFLAARLLP